LFPKPSQGRLCQFNQQSGTHTWNLARQQQWRPRAAARLAAGTDLTGTGFGRKVWGEASWAVWLYSWVQEVAKWESVGSGD